MRKLAAKLPLKTASKRCELKRANGSFAWCEKRNRDEQNGFRLLPPRVWLLRNVPRAFFFFGDDKNASCGRLPVRSKTELKPSSLGIHLLPPPPLSLSLPGSMSVEQRRQRRPRRRGGGGDGGVMGFVASQELPIFSFFFLVKTCFFRGVFFVFFLGSGEESVLSVSRLYWVYWWFIFWVNGFSCLCRLLDFNVRQAGFIWTELGFCQVSPIHYHARLNFIRVVRFVNFTQPWSLSIFI